jgi:hypothetical protein
MLVAMDIPAAAAGPWIALGIVLGILLLVLAGLGAVLVLRRTGAGPDGTLPSRPAPSPAGGYPEDDLPGFLAAPPGSDGAPVAPAGGWPALSSDPPARPDPEPGPVGRERGGSETARVLAVMAVAALLLVGGAAAIAAGSRSAEAVPDAADATDGRGGDDRRPVPTSPVPRHPAPGALAATSIPLGRHGLTARLTFGGVVLEQRAVGVTVAYPAVSVTASGGRAGALAHVRLPTFNCLTAQPPEDPVAAGCTPSVTEYADLPSPALAATRNGNRLRISGSFPTYVRPNGGPPVWTGRVYELLVTVEPGGGEASGGWVPAEGVLHLGQGRAREIDAPGVNVLRYADRETD